MTVGLGGGQADILEGQDAGIEVYPSLSVEAIRVLDVVGPGLDLGETVALHEGREGDDHAVQRPAHFTVVVVREGEVHGLGLVKRVPELAD